MVNAAKDKIKQRRAKQEQVMTALHAKHRRNDAFYDGWSIAHIATGILFGWIMSPFIALVIMVLWEPLENFIISPLLAKHGILFGYESLRNSQSDIVFDVIGISISFYLLGNQFDPPFHLF